MRLRQFMALAYSGGFLIARAKRKGLNSESTGARAQVQRRKGEGQARERGEAKRERSSEADRSAVELPEFFDSVKKVMCINNDACARTQRELKPCHKSNVKRSL